MGSEREEGERCREEGREGKEGRRERERKRELKKTISRCFGSSLKFYVHLLSVQIQLPTHYKEIYFAQ